MSKKCNDLGDTSQRCDRGRSLPRSARLRWAPNPASSLIPPESRMPTTTHSLEQCIENCTRCHRICLETAALHFRGEGRAGKVPESHIRLLLDCAEICQT